MNGLSVKNVQISEPYTLYSELEEAIEFSEGHTTSKVDDEKYGEGYLLAGLYSPNLNDAGLSEETVARLSNALDTENVSYAVFPNDQRKGYLPLVLDSSSRTYLKTNVKDIFDNEYIRWYIYFLPSDIDPDNNETSGSIMRLDEYGEPIAVNFDSIEEYLKTNGHVEISEEDDMFDDDIETNDDNEVKEDSRDDSNILELDLDLDDDSYFDNVFDEDESLSFDGSEDEDNTEDFGSVLTEEDTEDFSTDKEKDDILEIEDEGMSEEDNIPLDSETENKMNEEDIDDSEIGSEDNKNIEVNESVEKFTELPNDLKMLLDSIQLRKFSDFPKDGVHQVTANTMQTEINNANSLIEEHINNIKQNTINAYQSDMVQSYESINEAIDIKYGNESVRKYYQQILDDEEITNEKSEEDIRIRKKELEEEFYGPRLEEYKERLIAKAREWHEEENLEKMVESPLDVYSKDRKEYYDNVKQEKRESFNQWLSNAENVAFGKDQAKAVESAKTLVANQITEAKVTINALKEEMHKKNNELINIEYNERATENIRKTVGEQLETDEQAKIYKEQVDKLISEKAELETSFKQQLSDQDMKYRAQEDTFQSHISKMEKEKSDSITEYEKRLENADKEKENVEKEKQSIKEKSKRIENKGLRNIIIAASASALLITGGGFAIHSSSESKHEETIKKQESIIKSAEQDLNKEKNELKKEKDSKQSMESKHKKELEESQNKIKEAEKKLKEAKSKKK